MKNFFRQNETNIFNDDSFSHDLCDNYLTWIHQQIEWKSKWQISHHIKQMFAHNNQYFQNNFNSNIENKKDCFIIQHLFKQITNGSQNVTEKFKSLTIDQNHLRQNDAAPTWRKKIIGLSKSYFKTKKWFE